jgi:hypothetical protein
MMLVKRSYLHAIVACSLRSKDMKTAKIKENNQKENKNKKATSPSLSTKGISLDSA